MCIRDSINVMQAWDGFLGLIGRLPVFKWCIGILISIWHLRKRGFLAWPNISAGRMIVPERIGRIHPEEIALEANEWLKSSNRLKGQVEDLKSLRGKAGAVELITDEIIKTLMLSAINVFNVVLLKPYYSSIINVE